MEEQDPDVVSAAHILRSFRSKETAPKPKPKSPPKTMTSSPWAAGRRIENETVPESPTRMTSSPPAGRKKGLSTKRSRSCVGWIAAMDAANIVAQKTAEVLAAAQEAEEKNGGGRSSPDSPLDFLLNSAVAADATVKKARREEAESSATTEEKHPKNARREEAESSATTEEKQPKKARREEAESSAATEEKQPKNARREEAERSATTEEKQKLQKDREEQLNRKKEKRLASSFRRRQLVLELLKTSAPTCAPSASIIVAEGELTAVPSSSSSSSPSSSSLQASRGVKFLFDLNLPPPDDC